MSSLSNLFQLQTLIPRSGRDTHKAQLEAQLQGSAHAKSARQRAHQHCFLFSIVPVHTNVMAQRHYIARELRQACKLTDAEHPCGRPAN